MMMNNILKRFWKSLVERENIFNLCTLLCKSVEPNDKYYAYYELKAVTLSSLSF
jgi:hypothetical protein